METFWEGVVDFLILLAKVFVILLVVRTALFFMGYRIYIPIVDEVVLRMFNFLGVER